MTTPISSPPKGIMKAAFQVFLNKIAAYLVLMLAVFILIGSFWSYLWVKNARAALDVQRATVEDTALVHQEAVHVLRIDSLQRVILTTNRQVDSIHTSAQRLQLQKTILLDSLQVIGDNYRRYANADSDAASDSADSVNYPLGMVPTGIAKGMVQTQWKSDSAALDTAVVLITEVGAQRDSAMQLASSEKTISQGWQKQYEAVAHLTPHDPKWTTTALFDPTNKAVGASVAYGVFKYVQPMFGVLVPPHASTQVVVGLSVRF